MKEPRKEDYGFKDKMWPDYDSEKAFNDAFSEWHAIREDIHTVFDANTFGPDEVPVQMYEDNIRLGYTKCVLIDLNSNRQDMTYYIGWFDHDNQEWRFKNRSHRPISKSEAVTMGMRWSFLPLAIYDTNPELRKTVKL